MALANTTSAMVMMTIDSTLPENINPVSSNQDDESIEVIHAPMNSLVDFLRGIPLALPTVLLLKSGCFALLFSSLTFEHFLFTLCCCCFQTEQKLETLWTAESGRLATPLKMHSCSSHEMEANTHPRSTHSTPLL